MRRVEWKRAGVIGALLLAFSAHAELRLELVRESLSGSWCREREYSGPVPTDHYVVSRCEPRASLMFATPVPFAGRGLRVVEGRLVRREVFAEHALEPYAIDYDAATGMLVRRTPLFYRGQPARVFDPNPVAALNDPTLRDANDAAFAVPEAAYTFVELEDVVGSGPLHGPHVTMIDRQPPRIAPPDGGGPLLFDREQDGFEDVNAYFHLDRAQRHLQSLGYAGPRAIVPYAIEVDAHAASGLDNSFFLPSSTRVGVGALFFGDGGTDDAEDADLVVHEYMHAMLEWIAPGTFAGAFPSQARALSEGLGDYWAYSTHNATRVASGRDPFCFADWDARCWEDAAAEGCAYPPGSDCLRRLDSTKTMADYVNVDGAGVEHRNGEIWSSALRELHVQLGREVTDRIVLESLFAMPPKPTFSVAARRLLEADRLLYGGAHAGAICAAMNARGIRVCDDAPRGELTLHAPATGALPIPEGASGVSSEIVVRDPRAVRRVLVRVDVDHPSRGDLEIVIIAPDGTEVQLQRTSFDRTADVHTTFGLESIPDEPLEVLHGRPHAGSWRLVVRDLRPFDQGVLQSWALLLQFEGDDPLSARPEGGAETQMIPVVAHVSGANATRFRSDVRIANVGDEDRVAALVFTPSGRDGYRDFLAVNIAIESGQTVPLDDIVSTVFQTAGSGSLEVVGDVTVMSRTYAQTGQGTLGQQVPPLVERMSLGRGPLVAAAIPGDDARRNAGITETRGGSGVVWVNGRELFLEPFSHLQIPLEEHVMTAQVMSGDALVMCYLSVVDNLSGDAMFIPAQPLLPTGRTLMAPVISAEGVNGTEWRSDLWFFSEGAPRDLRVEAIGAEGGRHTAVIVLEPFTLVRDVLARLFHRTVTLAALRIDTPPGVIAMTRVRSNGSSQFVPMRDPEGPPEQHILFIESGGGYRTNVGISSGSRAVAEVVIFDATGAEISEFVLATEGGTVQAPVIPAVRGGRARVRFIQGRGIAYGSLVDNATRDATYVPGQ